MLDKIERLEKPSEIRDDMRLVLTPSCVSGNDVMHVDSISKSFGSEKLFENISFKSTSRINSSLYILFLFSSF